MRCPRCAHLTDRVVDSRQTQDGEAIRRRRECADCSFRYTTYERVERWLPAIVKRDDRREPFDRDKILAGLRRACEKRPVSMDKLVEIVGAIEQVMAESTEREVPSDRIGDLVIEHLKKTDDIAYLRFASVYRSFEDIGDFLREAREIHEDDSE